MTNQAKRDSASDAESVLSIAGYICDVWVCDNCMFHHEHGECGDCHGEGHDEEPLGLLSSSEYLTLDDERDEYSTAWCPTCGTVQHGARHLASVWEKREGKRNG